MAKAKKSTEPKKQLIDFSYGEFSCKLKVLYFSEYLRGPDGACALCSGDPCLEDKDSTNKKLKAFWKANPKASTCPVCGGRPT